MFSWKMSSSNQKEPPSSVESETKEDLPAAAIVAAQSNDKAARKSNKQTNHTRDSSVSDDAQSDDSGNKIISSVSSFFGQYFSNSNSRSTLNEVESSEQNEHGTRPSIKDGIVTWDPLESESHSELVSRHSSEMLRNPHTCEETDTCGSRGPSPTPSVEDLFQEGRPTLRQRSVTYNSPQNLAVEDAMFEGKRKRNPKQRHLVEVLGIDGVRVESLERSHEDFDRSSPSIPENDEDHDDQKSPKGDKNKHPDSNPSAIRTESSGSASHSRTSSREKQSVWKDLNEELHEPGPGITEPGKSKAEVAQDATHGKKEDESEGYQQQAKDNMSEEEKKAEAERQQRLLPGNRRIDHVLQPEGFMSMIANEYIVGLRAHFSYWSNKDLLWHIVRRLENLEVEPGKQDKSQSTADA